MSKTRIGAEIRRRLAIKDPQAGDPLVVCPPGLAAMWERICDRFGPDNAAVVGMSRLTAANYAAGRARRKTLRSAGPTLIDAAHNFRSNSQRRRTLLDFLKSGKRHKTILLSATPQNLAPRDILRQPELFPDPVYHGLAGKGRHTMSPTFAPANDWTTWTPTAPRCRPSTTASKT